MTEQLKNKLTEMTVEQLADIVLDALDGMVEKEQIGFIARHIDAKASLAFLGENDPAAFLEKVEKFCQECLDGVYYSDFEDVECYPNKNDNDYDYDNDYEYEYDYYDSDNGDDEGYDEYYSNSVWADTFLQLFDLSMMFLQSGDARTGYEAIERLLSCLDELDSDESLLGIDEPSAYLAVDWLELFTLHFGAVFQCNEDQETAIRIAFKHWMNHGSPCTEGFLCNVKDLALAESIILARLKKSENWAIQHRCFDLLAQLYERLGERFDKVGQAKALASYNALFYNDAIKGLCEEEDWQAVVETAQAALPKISPDDLDQDDWHLKKTHLEIRGYMREKLVEAHENLGNYLEAFEAAKLMFLEAPDFAQYLRTRGLAAKASQAPAFLAFVENAFKQNELVRYRGKLLRNIYSYEGETQKMLNRVLARDIKSHYDDWKYAARSFVCRAIGGGAAAGSHLPNYLATAAGHEGIGGMIRSGDDPEQNIELLLTATMLLKEIIEYHIDAGSRNRYEKAAYYMCVLQDIFAYLDRKDDFQEYFSSIMAQNNRRPALKDEMRIVDKS